MTIATRQQLPAAFYDLPDAVKVAFQTGGDPSCWLPLYLDASRVDESAPCGICGDHSDARDTFTTPLVVGMMTFQLHFCEVCMFKITRATETELGWDH